MTFVNVKDLHDRTSEILRRAAGGKSVFVTRRGKPVAVIRGLNEEELEDFVLVHHPDHRKALEEAFADLAAGRAIPLDEALTQAERDLERSGTS